MHYRNGREAKNGDRLIQLASYGETTKIIGNGILYDAVSGNDYCNGSVAPISHNGACIIDCLHADDVVELLKAAGLDKRPAGK
jgi:hypothetical protein